MDCLDKVFHKGELFSVSADGLARLAEMLRSKHTKGDYDTIIACTSVVAERGKTQLEVILYRHFACQLTPS
jgi:hypothetical protein